MVAASALTRGADSCGGGVGACAARTTPTWQMQKSASSAPAARRTNDHRPLPDVAIYRFPQGSLLKPHRLHEGAIPRRVPGRESNPRLPFCRERKGEVLGAECRQIGCRNDLTIDRVTVSPHDFDKGQGERPLNVRRNRPPVAGTFDGVRANQDLAGGHEE